MRELSDETAGVSPRLASPRSSTRYRCQLFYPGHALILALGHDVGGAELTSKLLPRIVTAHGDDVLGSHLPSRESTPRGPTAPSPATTIILPRTGYFRAREISRLRTGAWRYQISLHGPSRLISLPSDAMCSIS